MAGDVLKSVNGTDLTFENAQQTFTDMYMWSPGTKVKVVLDREGEEIIIEKELTQSYTTGQKLKENTKATEKQRNLRKAWLKG